MQTHQLTVSKGHANVHEIRNELFAFSEILDVLATSRADSLVVVYAGRPRAGEWLRALRAVGYEVPARRHPSAPVSEGDRNDAVATSEAVPARPPIARAPRRDRPNEHEIVKNALQPHAHGVYRP